MASEEQLGSWNNFGGGVLRKYEQHERRQPCTLVAASVSDGDAMQVPCFYCEAERHKNKEEYYTHYARELSQRLVSAYPRMPVSGADFVSENLKSILQEANASHRLSCKMGKKVTTVHIAQFLIEPPRTGEDEMEFAEERGNYKMKPASKRSVTSLMDRKLVKKEEEKKAWRASGCAICIEEIETWAESLAMDCGHVFHQKCLCRWLNASHVCPLCRYQMPTHCS